MGSSRTRPPRAVIDEGVHRLQLVLNKPKQIACAIRAFYEEEEVFAGSTFLGLSSNDPDTIEESDLLAVTLMGEIYPPAAVRDLLHGEAGREAQRWLRQIQPKEDTLWKKDIDIDAMHKEPHPVLCLWNQLLTLTDVGPTKVSKLMARKRPNLVPIYDRIIGERIATLDDYWYVFHAFMSDAASCKEVEEVRRLAGVEGVPLLRVLDTAVWMRFSGGRPAKRVRKSCDLPVDP